MQSLFIKTQIEPKKWYHLSVGGVLIRRIYGKALLEKPTVLIDTWITAGLLFEEEEEPVLAFDYPTKNYKNR